jgi:hypothetical protein
MTDALLVFAAQFLYVLVMGLQSLAVNNGRYLQAALQSFLLGSVGITITAEIVRRGEIGGATWWAYVISGPIGICASMFLFERYRKKEARK